MKKLYLKAITYYLTQIPLSFTLFSSMDTRKFDVPVENNNKKKLCNFFKTPKGCKNGAMCKFAHEDANWRETVELSPEEKLKDEVNKAIRYGSLTDLFKKMLSSEEDYNKYYNLVNMQFRGIATWKLQKKSIKKDLFQTLEHFNVPIGEDGVLSYGYVPFCLHFLFAGMAWKTFDGSSDHFGYREIESCIDEIIDIVSSIYKDEYKDVLYMTAQYCNPKYGDNVAHTATYFLCDKIMSHFKEQLSPEDFNSMIVEKNNDNFNIKELFNIQKSEIEDLKKKYKFKYNKNTERAKDIDEKEKAKQIYEFNISDLDRKIRYFEDQFFIERERIKFTFAVNDVESKFNTILSTLLKTENKFGIPYERGVLIELFNQINMNFKDKADEKINLILSKIPSNLFNVDHLIKDFKEKGYTETLWKFTMNSINEKTPLSFCQPLLYEFFKASVGLREACMGEYIMKLQNIYDNLKVDKKIEFSDLLTSSKLEVEILDKVLPF